MKDSEPRSAPPIPPRRLKRKNKPIVGGTDGVAEGATASGIRLETRPRLPPPPPPQRSAIQRREICPQLLPRSEISGNSCPRIYTAVKCQSHSIIGDKLIVSDNEEIKPALSTFGTSPYRLPMIRGSGKKAMAEEPARRKREKGKMPRPNEYPPLFFTLQDFQDVMADVENSYSRTLKNMTSFEPTPRPRTSKITSNDQLPETPKDGDEVLFRVTNTNLPFEKSPSEWGDVRNDPNHFIFEDYVDRRQIPAQSKSKLVLFGDDTFDRDDEDQTISTSRTASKVRFLVDSTTRDINAEKTELDSLQNIDSLPLDSPASQDLMLEEKQNGEKDEDEFGDVPFDSLLNISNDPPLSLGVEPSEDSTSSKTDFQTILVTAMVEPVPLIKKVDKPLENGDKVIDSNREWAGDKSDPFFEEEDTLKDEDAFDKTKSTCFEAQDLELDLKCEIGECSVPEHSDERDKRVENIDRKEERRRIHLDESLKDLMAFENNEDKSQPENVRRNSFLMNMLQGDEEPDERVVCKVVATHPKTPIHRSRIEGTREKGNPSAAVEAKSKLLGELSSSFSAIRLKPVNNGREEVEEKSSASDLKVDSMNVRGGEVEIVEKRENGDEDDDNEAEIDIKYKLNRNLDSVLDINVVKCKVSEEPIEESRKPRNEPQDSSKVCSQKTDDIIDKKYVDNDNGVCEERKIEFVKDDEIRIDKKMMKKKKIKMKMNDPKESNNNDDDDDGDNHSNVKVRNINNNNNKSNMMVEVASRSSVDKCAIVLKCNNNNDNNAMTPVDVSYDQSPNNVSIIPGSVRSFVKFYEIQGETSVGLDSNDTAAAAAVPKIKVEATGYTADNFNEISQKNIISNSTIGMEIENDIKYTIVERKRVVQKQCNTITTDKITIVNQPLNDKYDKSSRPISPVTEISASRSMPVKISDADHIREIQFHDGSSNIVQKQQDRAQIERRREPRSRSSASKKIHTAADMTSGIAPGMQDGSRTPEGLMKNVVRSGTTNHSVPKSSTSTINEHYTFYCTV